MIIIIIIIIITIITIATITTTAIMFWDPFCSTIMEIISRTCFGVGAQNDVILTQPHLTYLLQLLRQVVMVTGVEHAPLLLQLQRRPLAVREVTRRHDVKENDVVSSVRARFGEGPSLSNRVAGNYIPLLLII